MKYIQEEHFPELKTGKMFIIDVTICTTDVLLSSEMVKPLILNFARPRTLHAFLHACRCNPCACLAPVQWSPETQSRTMIISKKSFCNFEINVLYIFEERATGNVATVEKCLQRCNALRSRHVENNTIV